MATTTAAARPEVFTRKASGLVRVMSPFSAFVYNVLTMGLIFPWTYLWAPGALPGGKLVWGILLAMLIEIPIAFTYVWLSTALPRSGGDYVFQSRVFGGGVAFTVVMSGYVIWILQWVALSGWLLSYLGFAPLFLGLGATMGNTALSNIGIWFTSATGIIITSILNALVAMLILISGFKNYVRFQVWMITGTLIAFVTMLIVLFLGNPASSMAKIDAFAQAVSGTQNFVQTAINASKAAGIDLNPPFSLLATLLVAPIAWTSLQWATYSAQQNGEIKNARSFNSQVFIIVGSLIFTGILLAVLAAALEKAVGTEFLYVAGAGYWSGVSEATIAGFWLWPNMIAVALSASPLIVLLIALAVTSIPVITRIFLDLGLMNTRLARVVLSVAVIEDVMLYVALSIALGMVQGQPEGARHATDETARGPTELVEALHADVAVPDHAAVVLQPASERGEEGIGELYQQTIGLMNFQAEGYLLAGGMLL